MKYGHLELHIEELLKEKGISKNTICKELDIPRSNFNRYCRNEFQRLDAQLICKPVQLLGLWNRRIHRVCERMRACKIEENSCVLLLCQEKKKT